MRMRRKPWARPELDACPFYIKDPYQNIGKWHSLFDRKNPIHLELGCGKGTFISKLAAQNKDINYLAIDIKSEVLAVAKRNIDTCYAALGVPIDNVKIMSQDIERILDIMNAQDRVDRIYINFCNPWPKDKHKKRRLTHLRQLSKYKEFLAPNAQIWFKTDDDELFEDSLTYFKDAGFETQMITYDLHNSELASGNIMTEHEEMFSEMGIKIKFLKAVWQ